MAVAVNKLSARFVQTVREPGRYGDGQNLWLVVQPSGSASWRFVYRFGGRQREAGLGSTAKVSLSDARERAAEYRRLLGEGRDPIEAKREAAAADAARVVTFAQVAHDYIESHRPSWSNPKHVAQWRSTLGPLYCSAIRDKAVADIGIDDILAVLRPVWNVRPETARRVRMRIEKVLDAAKVRGLRTGENPARWRGNLDHLLPKPNRRTKHHPAMRWQEVPAYMAALKSNDSMAAAALTFLILTAARTQEALGAEWSEIDLEARVWTIPAARMKARRTHRVPLSDAALAVLGTVKGRNDFYVFPSPHGITASRPLSESSLLSLVKRTAPGATTHGFRSSFRDWVSEATTFSGEVAEQALAHAVANQVEAAYRRTDLFDKRRELMAAWAAYVTGPASGGNVVKFKASGQ